MKVDPFHACGPKRKHSQPTTRMVRKSPEEGLTDWVVRKCRKLSNRLERRPLRLQIPRWIWEYYHSRGLVLSQLSTLTKDGELYNENGEGAQMLICQISV